MFTDSPSNTLDSLPNWSARFHAGELAGECPDCLHQGFASEWVLPDGLGGFAMGSVSGLPMRRYHGLLCASLSPPVRRTMLLNALDEHIHIPQGGNCGCDLDVRLTGFQFQDQDPPIINPYLVEFTKTADSIVWTYSMLSQLGRVHVRKTLSIADHLAGCRVEYEIESGIDSDQPIEIQVRPLVSMRDFHKLNSPDSLKLNEFEVESFVEPAVEGVKVQCAGLDATLRLRAIGMGFEPSPSIWRNIAYDHETQRGQDDHEDLLCPGVFTKSIARNEAQTLSIEGSISDQPTTDWSGRSKAKRNRVRSSIDHALSMAHNPSDPILRDAIAKLSAAADDFVVDRITNQTRSSSIIAGYPWFSDWGRDTMIALPGLLLTTGRYEEANNALHTFANAIEHGLIPNRFDDAGGASHYNTVDASLWFIHACYQWQQAVGKPLDIELINACDEIIHAYINGTINNIGLDERDGLIFAGNEETQLTWMDALRDGVAFTPRHGKAIEINALWINALEARSRMNEQCSINPLQYAERARESLVKKMTVGPKGGLVDCLTPMTGVAIEQEQRSDELRPNQLFALSLPFVNLPKEHALPSLNAVKDNLLTPVGLRTLDPEHRDYCPHYIGSMTERDRAYHNGTVWPWLLGSYCESLLRLGKFDAESRRETQAIVLGLVDEMNGDSVGQLFEIYDAQPDEKGRHQPQGCPAQAWSVAEPLRVLVLSCQEE